MCKAATRIKRQCPGIFTTDRHLSVVENIRQCPGIFTTDRYLSVRITVLHLRDVDRELYNNDKIREFIKQKNINRVFIKKEKYR